MLGQPDRLTDVNVIDFAVLERGGVETVYDLSHIAAGLHKGKQTPCGSRARNIKCAFRRLPEKKPKKPEMDTRSMKKEGVVYGKEASTVCSKQ